MRLGEAAAIGALCLATTLWAARLGAQSPDTEGGEGGSDAAHAEDGAGADAPANGAAQAEGDASPAADDAEQDMTACLAAFSDAQKHRRAGKLLTARTALITCSQPTCPEAIVGKCTPWLREVSQAIPTVILVAKDHRGRDLHAVRVSLDGDTVAERLDGMPLELDPGAHTLVFEPPSGVRVELSIVAVQTQKNRVIEVTLAPPSPLPGPTPPSPVPPGNDDEGSISPWAWVGFGVGGAALIAGAVTGALAIDRKNQLEDDCHGTVCSTSFGAQFDEGARLAHASTGLFVVGGLGVAFGVAALLWLGDDPAPPASRGHRARRGSSTPRVSLHLGLGHVFARAEL